MSESCTSSKSPTTRLGGQHGEEGKEGEGEEDEAQSEALSRRREVFDLASKTSSTGPAWSRR